jgi:hypothetical protein
MGNARPNWQSTLVAQAFLKNDISRYWLALDETLAATKYFNMKISIFLFNQNQETLLITATAPYSSVLVKLHPIIGCHSPNSPHQAITKDL